MGTAVSMNYVLPLSIPDKTVELITDNHNISFGYRERGRATDLIYAYALNCDGSENMLLECPTSPIRTIFGTCFPAGIGVRCPLPGTQTMWYL